MDSEAKGDLMGIFDLFGKKDVKENLGMKGPYSISTSFTPFHLQANVRSRSTLTMRIKNMTSEAVMGSVVVEVPDRLSLDETGFTKQKEVRFGNLSANEEKEANVEVYSSTNTDKGEYTLGVTAFVHYRDYAHVLNAVKKRAILQVV
jgi:hypothetical protein